jgi:hypothetical protein
MILRHGDDELEATAVRKEGHAVRNGSGAPLIPPRALIPEDDGDFPCEEGRASPFC